MSAVPTWSTTDRVLGEVEVSVLRVQGGSPDLVRVHAWVSEERARFWGMVGRSLEEVTRIYRFLDGLETHHAWMVRVGGRAAALLQTYQPEHDPVGDCYPVQEGDLGLHLLLGPAEDAPGAGFTGRLGAALAPWFFADPGVQRLVVEPDARNEKAVARLRRSGFELGPEIELPTKRAVLAFLTRGRFEALQQLAAHGAPTPA
ncbi:GNAT family N-acetyltransferase [Auraticoccus monumenti]|uniref:Lysine N-acyltransferase MbtK n=1 Tax=Auraticoccus monumenti TaxID=675864 RepID=A0A1G6X9R6_9ACTN|nr:GNAT family N-acetyltransferase [Auraticoccus monumenti]SDD74583.1 Protein N-acetyltransferase, RimJ/RimL family [Auraticoccus monumenti]